MARMARDRTRRSGRPAGGSARPGGRQEADAARSGRDGAVPTAAR
jgi:hypothetical protein